MSGIHELQFRDSELNANNTRYDNYVAGGSDRERYIQWTVYSSIALSGTAFCLLVFVSILRKPSVRRKPFNLYLVFLIIPDLVFSFFCGVNCAVNAARGDYASEGWCRFQVFYCVWGIGSNAWINAVIARHLHDMLLCSSRRQRYFPPRRKQVVIESLLVYLWMGFIASWPFIPALPHQARLSAGLACLPHEYDRNSTLFLWLIFMPFFALIPTAYSLYVAFDVWRRNLLPPSGKHLDLAIYFFRLVSVFLIMWVPSIFLMFIAGGFLSSWVAFIGGCWSHLQGAVSAVASIMKRDIWVAFVETATCGTMKPSTTLTSTSFQLSCDIHSPEADESGHGCGEALSKGSVLMPGSLSVRDDTNEVEIEDGLDSARNAVPSPVGHDQGSA